jgi:hypothetical protein
MSSSSLSGSKPISILCRINQNEKIIILGIGGTIAAIIIGIIALIVIIAIIVFLIELLAPLFIGIIILAIIVGVGWWIYSKIKSR